MRHYRDVPFERNYSTCGWKIFAPRAEIVSQGTGEDLATRADSTFYFVSVELLENAAMGITERVMM